METHQRKADGRRIVTPQVKRGQLGRLRREEVTLAALARELAVAPQLIRQWQRLCTDGSAAVVPASELRQAQQRIRERERALGRKVMEIEILQTARDEVKKDRTTTA